MLYFLRDSLILTGLLYALVEAEFGVDMRQGFPASENDFLNPNDTSRAYMLHQLKKVEQTEPEPANLVRLRLRLRENCQAPKAPAPAPGKLPGSEGSGSGSAALRFIL